MVFDWIHVSDLFSTEDFFFVISDESSYHRLQKCFFRYGCITTEISYHIVMSTATVLNVSMRGQFEIADASVHMFDILLHLDG